MKVVVINPSKVFNAYDQYLMMGTRTCPPVGRWLNPVDLSLTSAIAKKGDDISITYLDAHNMELPADETRMDLAMEHKPDVIVINSDSLEHYQHPLPSYDPVREITDKRFLRELDNPTVILFGMRPQMFKPPNEVSYIFGHTPELEIPGLIRSLIDEPDAKIQRLQVERSDSPKTEGIPLPDYRFVNHQNQMNTCYSNSLTGEMAQISLFRGFSQRSMAEIEMETKLIRDRDEIKSVFFHRFPLAHTTLAHALVDIDVEWATQYDYVPWDVAWAAPTVIPSDEQMELLVQSGLKSVLLQFTQGNKNSVELLIERLQKAGIDIIVELKILNMGDKAAGLSRLEKWIEQYDFFGLHSVIDSMPARRGETITDTLEQAGVVNSPCRTIEDARKRWRDFEEANATLTAWDALRQTNPAAYAQYRKGKALVEK